MGRMSDVTVSGAITIPLPWSAVVAPVRLFVSGEVAGGVTVSLSGCQCPIFISLFIIKIVHEAKVGFCQS